MRATFCAQFVTRWRLHLGNPPHIKSEGTEDLQLRRDDAVGEGTLIEAFTKQL